MTESKQVPPKSAVSLTEAPLSQSQAAPLLSVIVPCFNEEQNIQPLYQRVAGMFEQAGISFELIFINDGSSDGTLAQIRRLSQQDERVRFASFSRNFGHEAASSCGFRLALGQAGVILDADLQDPPELILEMIALWQQGFDVVYGRRKTRIGEGRRKKVSSFLFYRLLNLFSDVPIPTDVGDFRLVSRTAMDHFNALPEKNRFVRGMFAWIGFRQTALEFERQPRQAGNSKYNWTRLLLLAFDALTSFSVAPLRLCMAFGALVTALSFLAAAVIIIQKLFFNLDVPGYAFATSGMFLLGGIQLLFLGVLGEYIGKIYTQVQDRPIYIVEERSDKLEQQSDKVQKQSDKLESQSDR
ncbi:glycosyltransferase family 2 protein [Shewanella cyperi]|uniref:Glycosyltransferase family 2 protein n=1 Tax=Shewanella cyperi TaxID=2814292 RepID=A0A974XPR9_9GAMM|nr:glycosyltransferase family 2 protein [Shewanella cyperi]QSX31183.1 glycosyltransferase family 2 protein [Shewanella cyperi]